MKKITGKFLKSIEEGSLVRVRWPDASADACDDGSPKVLLRDHLSVIYDSYGLWIGVSKEDIILTNDKLVHKNEYRGKINIPKRWVMEIEVIHAKKEEEKEA